MIHVHIISDTRAVEVHANTFSFRVINIAKSELSAFAGQMHDQPADWQTLQHHAADGVIYKFITKRDACQGCVCEVTPMPQDSPLYNDWKGL